MIQQTYKRLTAWLMALVMVATMLPTMALATAEDSGTDPPAPAVTETQETQETPEPPATPEPPTEKEEPQEVWEEQTARQNAAMAGTAGYVNLQLRTTAGTTSKKLYDRQFRFLYKGIIIKHNKTEPTYTKTSLFLCEKRRFFMARTEKGVVATI